MLHASIFDNLLRDDTSSSSSSTLVSPSKAAVPPDTESEYIPSDASVVGVRLSTKRPFASSGEPNVPFRVFSLRPLNVRSQDGESSSAPATSERESLTVSSPPPPPLPSRPPPPPPCPPPRVPPKFATGSNDIPLGVPRKFVLENDPAPAVATPSSVSVSTVPLHPSNGSSSEGPATELLPPDRASTVSATSFSARANGERPRRELRVPQAPLPSCEARMEPGFYQYKRPWVQRQGCEVFVSSKGEKEPVAAAPASAAPTEAESEVQKLDVSALYGYPTPVVRFGRHPEDEKRIVRLDEYSVNEQVRCRGYTPFVRKLDVVVSDDQKLAHLFAQLYNQDDEIMCNVVDFQPSDDWPGVGLDGLMKRQLEERLMFLKPRKVQKFVIPQLMAGRNVLCKSENASGKTMSFVLPIVSRVHNFLVNGDPRVPSDLGSAQPFAFVLCPTREIVIQTVEQFMKCVDPNQVSVGFCVGEYDIRSNIFDIQRACHILVATPGRALHFLDEERFNFSALHMFMVDEADRLFDRNFENDMKRIFEHLCHCRNPKSVSYGFFSATLNSVIERKVREIFGVAESAYIVNQNYRISPRLNFHVYRVARNNVLGEFLPQLLKEVLNVSGKNTKVLVFLSTKDDVDMVSCFLSQKMLQLPGLILGMSSRFGQLQRDRVMHTLRDSTQKQVTVITTNLLARGIHLPEVDHVIIRAVDARDATELIHQCGRTGRVLPGNVHIIIDEVTPVSMMEELKRHMESIGHVVPQLILDYLNEKSGPNGGGNAPMNGVQH